MGPMLNQNENQAFEQNRETQITKAHIDTPPPNAGPRDQPPPGQGPAGPYIPRNAIKPKVIIFPPALNKEQEIPEISNVKIKETLNVHMR
ncbi:MAG: hypothetical protein EZS28_006790 [Streblomastix strix]|uniref:Uncharacterized protein n=1 Tax=Streblomastix strix TaxID=222440 RepID=A0A5J4WRH2_9EUKA|nr:MAG: hypothetical protein EZS28_006790 [Streblomastix strix]